MTTQLPPRADVVIIGAGHNGLVSAILLARAGLSVVVLEAAAVIGGATRTEHPFAKVPELGQSTGSYLLGLMPPELLRTLNLTIPVRRRDPHYFLPTPGDRYLLVGADRAATRGQLSRFFSVADYLARFEFRSELLMSMYAVTDGLSGLNAGPDDPGTGNNFLVHNMCRLPGAGGTWMIVAGGMGTVSATFAAAATRAGAVIVPGTPVASVLL